MTVGKSLGFGVHIGSSAWMLSHRSSADHDGNRRLGILLRWVFGLSFILSICL
jgi:hypothetical protein